MKKETFWEELWSLVKMAVLALIIILPFKYYFLEPFIVVGSSMEPNFKTGEYLFINKTISKIGKIERGDILVFVPPQERSDSWLKYTGFFDPREKYIKRVIGLPGESIKIKNREVFIKKKNETEFKKLTEPYLKNNGLNLDQVVKLKDDEFFVLGDNRAVSYDSEEWGPIKESDILGEPIFRLLPLNKIEINPEQYNFSQK